MPAAANGKLCESWLKSKHVYLAASLKACCENNVLFCFYAYLNANGKDNEGEHTKHPLGMQISPSF